MTKDKKLTISVAALVLLCVCLCIISFALGYAAFEVKNNQFQTGGIELDLNGGKPVITEEEYNFEPGMTVEKPFYIKNEGTWAVYYQLYFDEVSGKLGDILDVTVMTKDKKEVLLTGKLSDLTKANVPALEDELAEGERKDLIMRFHYPEKAGNKYQGSSLTFRLSSIAVQTKNNPNREFE